HRRGLLAHPERVRLHRLGARCAGAAVDREDAQVPLTAVRLRSPRRRGNEALPGPRLEPGDAGAGWASAAGTAPRAADADRPRPGWATGNRPAPPGRRWRGRDSRPGSR